MSLKVGKSRQTIEQAFTDAGIDSKWFAGIVKKLGETPKQTTHDGEFIDSEHPDPHAARVALENVAKILSLYSPEKLKIIKDELDDYDDDEIKAELKRRGWKPPAKDI